MITKRIAPILRLAALLAAVVALLLTVWLAGGEAAEGRYTNSQPWMGGELVAPINFAVSGANEDDPDTAFQEDKAGFSAYHRVPAPESADGQNDDTPRLNIMGITAELDRRLEPDENNSPLKIRGKGEVQDYGLNFGIVTLPMVAAVNVKVPDREVTVYYDDSGWIAAYLAPDEPAAAIWKYDRRDGETAEEELRRNLLVLAVNEVIDAHNKDLLNTDQLEQVTHDGDNAVKYYDWQNADCNAFILFRSKSDGGIADSVKFVIPNTITEIDASAAALITREQDEGASTTASVLVDEQHVVTATAANPKLPLDAELFTLARDGSKTSLHEMAVRVDPDGEEAAGVVMLVYQKPEDAED